MLKNCLLCNRGLNNNLDLSFILSFRKITPKLVCEGCITSFSTLVDHKTCIRCGKLSAILECADCQQWNDQFVNRAMFQYDEAMRNFFQHYKFQGDYLLRKVFQDQFVNFIQKILKENELIVPIPVDESTMTSRGFKQVTGLMEGLDWKDVLINQRSNDSLHQFQRSRRERLQQDSSFVLKSGCDINGEHILLVDDIYTTGATLRQARTTLLRNGATQVRSVTLCR